MDTQKADPKIFPGGCLAGPVERDLRSNSTSVKYKIGNALLHAAGQFIRIPSCGHIVVQAFLFYKAILGIDIR